MPELTWQEYADTILDYNRAALDVLCRVTERLTRHQRFDEDYDLADLLDDLRELERALRGLPKPRMEDAP